VKINFIHWTTSSNANMCIDKVVAVWKNKAFVVSATRFIYWKQKKTRVSFKEMVFSYILIKYCSMSAKKSELIILFIWNEFFLTTQKWINGILLLGKLFLILTPWHTNTLCLYLWFWHVKWNYSCDIHKQKRKRY